jgi:hypothetical protein
MDLDKKNETGKLIDDGPFAMMVNLQSKYNWVLETIAYKDVEQLKRILKKGIIDRARQKRDELRETKKRDRPTVIDARQYE